MANSFLVLLFVILSVTSFASAFWWGSPETNPTPTRYYYHKRLIQNNPYLDNNRPSNGIPAVPVQVPLQAQLAPLPNVQNVQLVPCLCPVSQEYPYESQQFENLYLQPLSQGQLQQPKILQQQPNK